MFLLAFIFIILILCNLFVDLLQSWSRCRHLFHFQMPYIDCEFINIYSLIKSQTIVFWVFLHYDYLTEHKNMRVLCSASFYAMNMFPPFILILINFLNQWGHLNLTPYSPMSVTPIVLLFNTLLSSDPLKPVQSEIFWNLSETYDSVSRVSTSARGEAATLEHLDVFFV